MFGVHDPPFSLECGGLHIGVEEKEGILRYVRETGDIRVEKILGQMNARVLIEPVEPVNLPKEVTRYLEIEFDTLVIGPQSEQIVFLKFPVETGVFIESKENADPIDLISLAPQKFSLYGNPRSGVITRYYRSRTYLTMPEVDPVREGVLRLAISNPLKTNVEIARVVLDAGSMMIYYSRYASMVAVLQIVNSKMGESYFTDEPLEPGMKRAKEIHRLRKMPVVHLERAIVIGGVEHPVFTMEWGF